MLWCSWLRLMSSFLVLVALAMGRWSALDAWCLDRSMVMAMLVAALARGLMGMGPSSFLLVSSCFRMMMGANMSGTLTDVCTVAVSELCRN